VLVRIIVLLLAVMMMTGNAAEVCASPDVASMVDDASNLDPPILPAEVTVPLPDRQEPVCIEAPRSPSCGRMHAVLVFRPPRLFASR
jgi:hypothetical protein